MKDKLYSISELTTVLNLHQKTILRFIHEGKIKANKIGRSWMVTEADLKEYVHGEASDKYDIPLPVPKQTIKDRIKVSAVIEINEYNSDEATRVSNSLMAMLNSGDDSYGKTRFDFFYYPEIQKAKYLFYGEPKFISMIMDTFDMLCQQKGD